MMFHGTYTSDFYRAVRNLLHDQVTHPGTPAARGSAGTSSSNARKSSATRHGRLPSPHVADDRAGFRLSRTMADILLTHGYFLAEDEKERQIMKPYPPLGLLYLSAFLKSARFLGRSIRQHVRGVRRARESVRGRARRRGRHLHQPHDAPKCAAHRPGREAASLDGGARRPGERQLHRRIPRRRRRCHRHRRRRGHSHRASAHAAATRRASAARSARHRVSR